MKTLEETAEEFLIRQGCQRMDCDGENCNFFEDVQPKDLIEFAIWQEERMYSEEEVYNLLLKLPNFINMSDTQKREEKREWFEQFKKK